MKYKRIIYWILYIILIPGDLIFSQEEYSFKQISNEQGLPGTNVRDQFQDSRGIMWIAVEAMGLCRYDGHKFKLYINRANDSTSLSSNFVNRISEDSLGNLWIGTDYGLNMYDYKTAKFRSFFHNEMDSTSVPDNTILSVDNDRNGNIWVSTTNGFAKINLTNFTFKRYLYCPKEEKGQYKVQVNRIYLGKNGTLWLATEYGLYKYNLETLKYSKWENSGKRDSTILSSTVLDITEDKYGNLWLATGNGVDRFIIRTEKFNHFTFKEIDLNDMDQIGTNDVYLDENDLLWCATTLKGVLIINTNNNSYTHVNKTTSLKNGLQSDHIRYIYEDNNGTIWVGTKFGGIFKYIDRNKIFNNWPEKYLLFKQLNNKYVLDIFEDNQDVFWLCTKFSGLYKVDLKNNKIDNFQNEINNPNSLNSNRVRTVYKDSKGNLWAGTDIGIDLMINEKNNFRHITDKTTYRFLEDTKNNLWVATSRGIFVLKRTNLSLEKFKNKNQYDFFNREDYEIMDLFEDNRNNIYYSTRYNGVFVYNLNTNALINYSKDSSPETDINANMLRDIFEDDNKNIWIGTKEAGLKYFDQTNKKFITYDVNDGLPTNMILCIQQDYSGNLWLGTNNGLSKFDVKNKTFSNFNIDHGVKSVVSELGADHRFSDGALFFGGSNGFNIFYPDEIVKSSKIAPLIILSIKISENEIYRDILSPLSIKLKHNQNNISFEFIITNYNQPNRHQFKCFMKGIDSDWKILGNRNYVSYTNLGPGNYVFHVNGANEMGVWDTEMTVAIKVLRPWWKTWIFRILVIIIFSGCIVLFYYIRIGQIKNQKKILEKEVAKRTKELNETNTLLEERQQKIEEQSEELRVTAEDLSYTNENLRNSNATKDKLFSIIAHDLKNPFNSVLGFTEILSNRISKLSQEKIVTMVKTIHDASSNIYSLLENLLNWSRSQTGTIILHPEKISLFNVINENIKLLNNLIIKKEIIVENNISENLFTISDKQILSTIIRNIFTNAIKYTDKGTIEISADVGINDITIKIQDTGIGIPPEKLNTLFEIEKSKSTQGTRGEQGTGLGLIVCKEFVESNGGKIWAISSVNTGTSIFFTCPVFIENS